MKLAASHHKENTKLWIVLFAGIYENIAWAPLHECSNKKMLIKMQRQAVAMYDLAATLLNGNAQSTFYRLKFIWAFFYYRYRYHRGCDINDSTCICILTVITSPCNNFGTMWGSGPTVGDWPLTRHRDSFTVSCTTLTSGLPLGLSVASEKNLAGHVSPQSIATEAILTNIQASQSQKTKLEAMSQTPLTATNATRLDNFVKMTFPISNFIPHIIMDVITYPCWD